MNSLVFPKVSGAWDCYRWNRILSPHSYVEVLTPIPQIVTIFGEEFFTELIKSK